jgi:flavodoxin
MKILLSGVCVVLIILSLITIFKLIELKNVQFNKPVILNDKNILIVYYSNNGNTKKVADTLHSVIGGDIKQIQLQEKYPANIFTMTKTVRSQIKQDYLPKIDEIDISNYDVIFIGSPIWNFTISLPMKSFLKNNEFENKILIPFFTYSGGADKNKVNNDIKNLTNAKEIRHPLFIFENGIILLKEQIINWLNGI